MVKVRVLNIEKENNNTFEFVSIFDTDNVSELIKMFNFMKENDIDLERASKADSDDNDVYKIDSISFVTPAFGSDIIPYLAVYVKEIYKC